MKRISIVANLVLIAVCFFTLQGFVLAQTKKITKPGPTWIAFKGNAIDKGQHYLLKGVSGGSFEIAKENVRITGRAVRVRVGADAKIVEQPKKIQVKNRAALLSDCHEQDDCPSKCCACIGLVRVCCGEGGTRGVCLGAWGCP